MMIFLKEFMEVTIDVREIYDYEKMFDVTSSEIFKEMSDATHGC